MRALLQIASASQTKMSYEEGWLTLVVHLTHLRRGNLI